MCAALLTCVESCPGLNQMMHVVVCGSTPVAAKRPRSEAACPLAVSPCGCCTAYTSSEGRLFLVLCSPLMAVSNGMYSVMLACWVVISDVSILPTLQRAATMTSLLSLCRHC